MFRRDFLKTSLTLTAAGLVAPLATPQIADAAPNIFANGGEGPEKGLTFYPNIAGGRLQLHQLWIRKDNTVLTSYNAHPTLKYPYLNPVAGPVSGLSLTSESSRPWPHHRALFFGCDRVNGGNYWQDSLTRGQIVSQGPQFTANKLTSTYGEFTDRCFWRQGIKDPIIEDNRKYTLTLLDDKRYVIDAEINVKALTDITIANTNHGLFGIRCAPELAPAGGGNLLSSNGGKNEQETLGKPANWIAFYGKRPNIDITEGIAVFCPSQEPHPVFKDCPWFVRDYGNISPTPMLWLGQGGRPKEFKLPNGEELKLRYRVAAFAGTPEQADLNGLWKEWNTAR